MAFFFFLRKHGDGMFRIGEFVVYGYSEVCYVKDIGNPAFLDTAEPYYYLQPVCNPSSITYVRTSKQSKNMRSLISSNLAKEYLEDFANLDVLYEDNEKNRQKAYADIFRSCDFLQWMKMFKGISEERERRALSGHKLLMSDANSLNKVEDCIAAEISKVFQISLEQAKTHLGLVVS